VHPAEKRKKSSISSPVEKGGPRNTGGKGKGKLLFHFLRPERSFRLEKLRGRDAAPHGLLAKGGEDLRVSSAQGEDLRKRKSAGRRLLFALEKKGSLRFDQTSFPPSKGVSIPPGGSFSLSTEKKRSTGRTQQRKKRKSHVVL